MLLIGSVADEYNESRFGVNDIDIIMYPKQVKRFVSAVEPLFRGEMTTKVTNGHVVIRSKDSENPLRYDIAMAFEGSSNYDLLKYSETLKLPKTKFSGIDVAVADRDIMFVLRESHKFRNYDGFHKNQSILWHYKHNLMMYREGRSEELQRILKKREEETYANQKKISLNQKKSEFFANDNVPYVYDHDSIHELVARFCGYEEPAYKQMSVGEVLTSNSIWHRLPEEVKDRCVMEEAMVIALERGFFPFHTHATDEQIVKWYQRGLQNVCTTLTSGAFRDYANNDYVHFYNVGRKIVVDLFRKVYDNKHLLKSYR